jgi:hypothetical protein
MRTWSVGCKEAVGVKMRTQDKLFDRILNRPAFCNDTQIADNPVGNLKKKNRVVTLADIKGDE